MNEIVLDGCRPTPLAHYLKALGVLRLVSEQKDKKARGFWRQDRFVVGTCLSREELERFFLEEYRPTPIVGPWGARSGFYPDSSESSAREALTQLVEAEGERFSIFQEAVEAVRALLEELHVNKKEDVDGQKQHIMELCRARLPDEALSWLDACYSLLADDARFPPLLGSGGNEGSGSYMSGFMQQIAACLVRRQHDGCLSASLWDDPSKGVTESQTPGHFIPNAGGANLSNGYGTKAAVNPWDYILCLEGALVFTAAATRRMDLSSPSRTASFPFTVENSIAGYSTAVAEKNRGEIWVPTWTSPATCEELVALFAEGRASVGNRMAKNGVDFARAIASLGVDRGIDRFFRFGFQERNGQNNMAVFLGALDVGPRPNVELLGPIDGWLSSYGWKSQGDRAPASAQRALRRLESSIFALCMHGDRRTQGVLTALGECERMMATSLRWTIENHLRPVPALDPKWLTEANDGSVEYRLAASVASVAGKFGTSDSARYIHIREQFESVRTRKGLDGLRVAWQPDAGRDVVWTPGHLVDGLNAVFARRLLIATQTGSAGLPDSGFPQADLGDIADFIEGRFDDRRFTQLLHGLLLLDWTRVKPEHLPARRATPGSPIPCAFYALLKLCFGAGTSVRDGLAMPVVPRIHRLAAGGQSAAATQEALRGLRGSGFVPALKDCTVVSETAQRAAAALLFPLSNLDQERLRIRLLRPDQKQNEDGYRQETTVKANGVIL